jgi:tetratricopeptide (TPR) repeat protein
MDAMASLRTAASQNPASAQVRFFLGRISYKNGFYADAKNEFLACLNLEPEYPKALENLGLTYEAAQEHSKAADAYQRAIELERAGKTPPSEDPYIEYGLFLVNQGKIERGVALLRNGLAKNPSSSRANFELGKLLFRLGNLDEAESLLVRAASLDANFSEPHFVLGQVYQKRNLRMKAAEQLALFEKLNQIPENREARVSPR